MSFHDNAKVAMVTGGGQGIGQAIAERLLCASEAAADLHSLRAPVMRAFLM